MEFKRLMVEFGEAAGIDASPDSQGTVWLDSDGVLVTVQHRPEREDVVIFTLPLGEMSADETMMRRALELSSAGFGTGGFFLGLSNGFFTLSAVLALANLDAETLAKRMLALSAATRHVAQALGASVADASVARFEAESNGADDCNQFVFRV